MKKQEMEKRENESNRKIWGNEGSLTKKEPTKSNRLQNLLSKPSGPKTESQNDGPSSLSKRKPEKMSADKLKVSADKSDYKDLSNGKADRDLKEVLKEVSNSKSFCEPRLLADSSTNASSNVFSSGNGTSSQGRISISAQPSLTKPAKEPTKDAVDITE